MTNNMPQEPEESPELAAQMTLVNDVAAQVQRVKAIYTSGQLTPELAVEELCETFLPLLQDIAERGYQTQLANEEFNAAVEDKLWPDGAAPEDGEDAPGLWPEDARVFKQLLTEYLQLLESSTDEATRVHVDERVKVIKAALARIDELTLDEEDGEETEPAN